MSNKLCGLHLFHVEELRSVAGQDVVLNKTQPMEDEALSGAALKIQV